MAKMLEVALWPRFFGCFFPAALARLWREGGRKGEREEGRIFHTFQNISTLGGLAV